MLLSKTIEYETSDSANKIIRRLQQVVETKNNINKSSCYKGEFTEEGFLIITKTSAASLPHVIIFGEFIRLDNGTKVIIKIRLPLIVKIIFWILNVILAFQLIARYLNSSKDWPLFLIFLLFLWTFFQIQLWLEVKTLKGTLEPMLSK
jgi:hypothetical protein